MRVLGIDPGYAICGYGVVDAVGGRVSPVAFGAITTQAHTRFEDRLAEIYEDLRQLLAKYTPDALAVETLFFSSNQKTAVAVAEARGVILLAATQAGLEVYEYSPLQVKQSVVGYGKAAKKQVQEMVRRLLALKRTPKPDDAADALAIAVCHARSAQSLQFGRVKTRRQGMGYE
jgi:crossover junction endodeoxyribonuclease RuvC